MKYTKVKYKYQLLESFTKKLNYPFPDVESDFFTIKDNIIYIKKFYSWDGASGPTIDSKTSMIAGLVHDCLYQSINTNLMDPSYKATADKEFLSILLENHMNKFRAYSWYFFLGLFGKVYSKLKNKKVSKILEL